VASPSDRQLEKHIKLSAVDSAHVIFTDHARQRMRQRYINDPMALDVLCDPKGAELRKAFGLH